MNTKPLAEILRPSSLEEFIGQEHLIQPGAVLYEAIRSGNLPSMIFWGPPGTGKTTLALLIANILHRPFFHLSAINSGVKDVRQVIEAAEQDNKRAILFIDEIHRFSKAQQDALLGAVEAGTIALIGATTENPSFEVITPLLSRCQVFILKPLTEVHLNMLIARAINYYQKEGFAVEFKETEALLRISGGDARKLYNAIELIFNHLQKKENPIVFTNDKVLKLIQKNLAAYDKGGEQHYDIISALIKSIRGSDPNAAVYWLARMVEGGEDPLFIARRMIILASEDIGNANPNALLLANTCFDAVHKIGWPEARIILSQTAIFLACSPKSNSAYMAIDNALELVRNKGDLPVPLHLRNAPTKLMKEMGYGDGYLYAHSFPGNFIKTEFMPDAIRGTKLFEPGNNRRENEMRAHLKSLWKDKYEY